MTARLTSAATAALVAFAASFATAQDAPIIREEGGVKVRTSSDGEKLAPRPERAPDPRTAFVGVVNQHVLTRDQLDQMVYARSSGLSAAEVDTTRLGVVANIDPDAPSDRRELRNQLENVLIDNQQEIALEAAIRDLEGELVREWAEHKILSDEARRHGFIIERDEFESRMREIEREYLGRAGDSDRLLEVFGMSRAELEQYVNEALLIEKLLLRWIELNITEDEMRTAYSTNPAIYRTPPMYRAPLFTIVLLGDETPAEVRGLERLADEVRDRLDDGEDPATVFADQRFDIHQGVFGEDLGYYDLRQNTLPPEVARALRDMEVGDVSKVLKQYVSRDGRPALESLHVVMLTDKTEPRGDTFESALPELREASLELARERLLAKLVRSGNHRMITNTRGISPDKLPNEDALKGPKPPMELTF